MLSRLAARLFLGEDTVLKESRFTRPEGMVAEGNLVSCQQSKILTCEVGVLSFALCFQ